MDIGTHGPKCEPGKIIYCKFEEKSRFLQSLFMSVGEMSENYMEMNFSSHFSSFVYVC